MGQHPYKRAGHADHDKKSNQEIDRFLVLIGPSEQDAGAGQASVVTTLRMPDDSIQTFDSDGKRIQ